MINLPAMIESYLLVHGVSTIGAIIVFLVRTEHRITKLETTLKDLKDIHDSIMLYGPGHRKQ